MLADWIIGHVSCEDGITKGPTVSDSERHSVDMILVQCLSTVRQ